MLRKISAVIALLVVAAIVWRYSLEEEATTPLPTSAVPSVPVSAGAETKVESVKMGETVEMEKQKPLAAERVESDTGQKTVPPLESRVRGTPIGRLDDVVPRPILDGHVWIRLNLGGSDGETSTNQDFQAPVNADGTFEFADLPAGRGQILALCRGWVSRRTPYGPIEAATLRLGRELAFREIEQVFQEEAPETPEAQRIALPARGLLVVAMERTGSLAVSVLEQDGSPIAGASVTTSPNVQWIGGSSIFPWREWTRTTDASGRAFIDDLPADDSLAVQAHHDSFRMLRAARDKTPSVKIVSARTAELTLRLEPKEN